MAQSAAKTPTTPPTPLLPPASSLVIKQVDQTQYGKVFQKWAAELLWNPSVDDPAVLPLADPSGFFVAYLARRLLPESVLLPDEHGDDASEEVPVACISAVRHDAHNGFIGFYIVRNDKLRGAGYGIRLFRAAMEYLGADRNAGLDGVVAQQGNYARSGFGRVWDTWRFTLTLDAVGTAAAADPAVPAGLQAARVALDGVASIDGKSTVATVSSGTGAVISLAAVSAFIEQHSGFARREAFVAAWLSAAAIESTALVDAASGQIVAFGSIRKAITGYRIGPVFAADAAAAAHVVGALVAVVRRREKLPSASPNPQLPLHQETKVFADVCMSNKSAREVFARAGFSDANAFVCGRMFTKGNPLPDAAIGRVFAVMTLEVG